MKKTILFPAGALLAFNFAIAQTPGPKIGYINSTALLNAMPEKAKADSALTAYQKSFQDQPEIMGKEYQTEVQQAQANEKTMSDVVREVKTKEL